MVPLTEMLTLAVPGDRKQPVRFIWPRNGSFNHVFSGGIGDWHCGGFFLTSNKCETSQNSCQCFAAILPVIAIRFSIPVRSDCHVSTTSIPGQLNTSLGRTACNAHHSLKLPACSCVFDHVANLIVNANHGLV